MFFDTHAHLESPRYAGDSAGVIERARAAGVTRIVTCGSDLATSAACVQIAQRNPGVYAAAGIHPHEARGLSPSGALPDATLLAEALLRIREWARRQAIVAVGEIGLDYHYEFSPRPVQQGVLAAQLRLAGELGLPVILHNRESDADFRDAVEQGPANLAGVLHCFMGSASLAEWALSRGLYLGVAGPVTFRGMDELVSVVRTAPLDRLLVETDSPYLAPHPHRGARNEPALVVSVAQRVAEIRGMSLEELAHITIENGQRLFGVA
jgi:TatD DNase family protein